MTALPRLPRIRPLWLAVLCTAGLVTLLLLIVTHLPFADSSWACTNVGTGLPSPANGGGGPYGNVRSCRVLDSNTNLFSGIDGSVFLLLDTDTGLVAVRVDYRDTALGRQYRAEAVELTAGQTPNLSAAEARQLQRSIQDRGGIRTRAWIVSYGDG
jgi:hypothetical protein